jgi:hypothetical protein
MMTVFEGIPEVFIDRYTWQFEEWAASFRVRGKRCAIVFDVMPGQMPTMDAAGNLVWAGAWLVAELEGGSLPRMVVRPATDWDRNLIEVHCWQLRRSM